MTENFQGKRFSFKTLNSTYPRRSRLAVLGDSVPLDELAERFTRASGQQAHTKVLGTIEDLEQELQEKQKVKSII